MTTDRAIKRRNRKLQNFFDNLFPEIIGTDVNISIIGNENTPAIIIDHRKVLSCYVHNFDLRFTDLPSGGEIMHEEKLTWEMNPDHEKIRQWFHEAQHRSCYKVKVKGTDLYLAGYNFLKRDKENPKGRYPVFAPYGFKYYFTKEKAEEIVTDYSRKGMELEVV
ncbi:hypothetical protein [Psychroflexus aestuariivivens]|uniref:hypothetical protein n=1 Tax=Psychroflexus aestuariivivens TaxID=1795040 RepID=UPI000FD777B7|nr:hypothetical protein [Psychroflexus aestuariivivens]